MLQRSLTNTTNNILISIVSQLIASAVSMCMVMTVAAPGNEGMSELINKTGCSVISVPSLRQIPGVIPKLTALYINDLNVAFSRQIFGAAPEAISMQVFREENYNQSRTAARLGISRTTLWRMLKDN